MKLTWRKIARSLAVYIDYTVKTEISNLEFQRWKNLNFNQMLEGRLIAAEQELRVHKRARSKWQSRHDKLKHKIQRLVSR